MEKAIEIKRRAQRCIQNGDLDGALGEYEKLVAADDSDPYNFVLLADLLYKKGDHGGAARRYLSAADAYQKNTLYKNAIAVCKKMMRLSLSPALVLQKLAVLHGLDGLTTESVLFHMQHADLMLREDKPDEAIVSLKSALDANPENVKLIEKMAEVHLVKGDKEGAATALASAIERYEQAGQGQHAERVRNRLGQIKPGHVPRVQPPRAPGLPMRGEIDLDAAPASGPSAADPSPALERAAPLPAETPAEPGRADADGPGLRFESPALDRGDRLGMEEPATHTTGSRSAAKHEPAPAADGDAAGDGHQAPPAPGMAKIEKLLTFAQEQFRAGKREAASTALVDAARAYEEQGEFDNAATIYRSLSRGATAARDVMTMWLKNCEVRRDMVEAAQVACELGDLSLNEGDPAGARTWFKRARSLDATNALALRRLERLSGGEPAEVEAPAEVAVAPEPVASSPSGVGPHGFEPGRVEVEVGRGGAVTFDLGSLVSEFQRGIEAQISGDAQGHYDLAMTYREMGLLDQAIEAFRNAAVDPAFVVRSTEMIGRSLLDEGRFDDAAREFEGGLNLPGLTPMARADMRYQLGLAHEAAGRLEQALAEFERVYSMHASYPDVAVKIRVLRKTLESL